MTRQRARVASPTWSFAKQSRKYRTGSPRSRTSFAVATTAGSASGDAGGRRGGGAGPPSVPPARRPRSGLEPLPELAPPLPAAAAALVLAAGVDGAVRELDGEGAVGVGVGERALREGVEGAALPGLLGRDGDAVAPRARRGGRSPAPRPPAATGSGRAATRRGPGAGTASTVSGSPGRSTTAERRWGRSGGGVALAADGAVALSRSGPRCSSRCRPSRRPSENRASSAARTAFTSAVEGSSFGRSTR